MCKAPKPPKPREPKKPEFLRNRYLDEFVGDAQAVKSLKAGRSSLRIPLGGTPAGIGGTPAVVTSGITAPAPTSGANIPPRSGNFLPPQPIAPRGANRQIR